MSKEVIIEVFGEKISVSVFDGANFVTVDKVGLVKSFEQMPALVGEGWHGGILSRPHWYGTFQSSQEVGRIVRVLPYKVPDWEEQLYQIYWEGEE
jgi:hypothetical protein